MLARLAKLEPVVYHLVMNQSAEFSHPSGVPSAWEAARLAGFDMDLIEDCLALSPAERIRQHTLALLTAEELRRAMKEREDASAGAAPEPSGE